MIGLVVIGHGKLAVELLRAAEMIVGQQAQTKAVSVTPSQTSEDIFQQTKAAIQEVNNGQGVLVLTDMFGGTPSNISLSFLDQEEVEVITGVNLPMLIKLDSCRKELSLKELKNEIVKYGRENILVASNMLAGKLEAGKSKAKKVKK
jgi:PTS system mannose-specific IIA component